MLSKPYSHRPSVRRVKLSTKLMLSYENAGATSCIEPRAMVCGYKFTARASCYFNTRRKKCNRNATRRDTWTSPQASNLRYMFHVTLAISPLTCSREAQLSRFQVAVEGRSAKERMFTGICEEKAPPEHGRASSSANIAGVDCFAYKPSRAEEETASFPRSLC